MNLIQAANQLKSLPDEFLATQLQRPDGQFPPYLVMTELQNRTQMRRAAMAEQETPATSMAEELAQQYMQPRAGIAGIAAQQQMQQAGGVPQMAGGGIVAFNDGGTPMQEQTPEPGIPEALEALMQYYGDPAMAVAALHMGPEMFDQILAQAGENWMEAIPPETHEYVADTMANMHAIEAQQQQQPVMQMAEGGIVAAGQAQGIAPAGGSMRSMLNSLIQAVMAQETGGQINQMNVGGRPGDDEEEDEGDAWLRRREEVLRRNAQANDTFMAGLNSMRANTSAPSYNAEEWSQPPGGTPPVPTAPAPAPAPATTSGAHRLGAGIRGILAPAAQFARDHWSGLLDSAEFNIRGLQTDAQDIYSGLRGREPEAVTPLQQHMERLAATPPPVDPQQAHQAAMAEQAPQGPDPRDAMAAQAMGSPVEQQGLMTAQPGAGAQMSPVGEDDVTIDSLFDEFYGRKLSPDEQREYVQQFLRQDPEQSKRDMWMALAQGGIGMAAGTSPNFMVNMAQGMQSGLGSIQQSQVNQQRRDSMVDLLALQRDQDDEARRRGLDDFRLQNILQQMQGAEPMKDSDRIALSRLLFDINKESMGNPQIEALTARIASGAATPADMETAANLIQIYDSQLRYGTGL